MKNKHHRIRNLLLEILGEIVITVLFFGIGWLILRGFGIDFSWDSNLPDVAIFLGSIIFLATFLAYFFSSIEKRKNKKDRNTL